MNGTKDNSYAVCRIKFYVTQQTSVTLTYINYAESTYDYGIIGNVDQELGLNNNEDDDVDLSLKGQQSSSSVDHEVTIPQGEHFIDIKFKKDGSADSDNDCFQFKITSTSPTLTELNAEVAGNHFTQVNAVAADVRDGKFFVGNGGLVLEGTAIIGSSYDTPSISVSTSGVITATANGKSGQHTLSSSDDTDFVASNIKSGVQIFGVTGSYGGSSGSSINPQSHTVNFTQSSYAIGMVFDMPQGRRILSFDAQYQGTSSNKYIEIRNQSNRNMAYIIRMKCDYIEYDSSNYADCYNTEYTFGIYYNSSYFTRYKTYEYSQLQYSSNLPIVALYQKSNQMLMHEDFSTGWDAQQDYSGASIGVGVEEINSEAVPLVGAWQVTYTSWNG